MVAVSCNPYEESKEHGRPQAAKKSPVGSFLVLRVAAPSIRACLGRHLRLAGRCPNNSSLFPPLAAVVVVTLWAYSAENYFYFAFVALCGALQTLFSRRGVVTPNCICSAAFYESAALRASACSPERADFPRPGEDVTAGDKKGNLSRSD